MWRDYQAKELTVDVSVFPETLTCSYSPLRGSVMLRNMSVKSGLKFVPRTLPSPQPGCAAAPVARFYFGNPAGLTPPPLTDSSSDKDSGSTWGWFMLSLSAPPHLRVSGAVISLDFGYFCFHWCFVFRRTQALLLKLFQLFMGNLCSGFLLK